MSPLCKVDVTLAGVRGAPGCMVPVVSMLSYPKPVRVGSGLAGSAREPGTTPRDKGAAFIPDGARRLSAVTICLHQRRCTGDCTETFGEPVVDGCQEVARFGAKSEAKGAVVATARRSFRDGSHGPGPGSHEHRLLVLFSEASARGFRARGLRPRPRNDPTK